MLYICLLSIETIWSMGGNNLNLYSHSMLYRWKSSPTSVVPTISLLLIACYFFFESKQIWVHFIRAYCTLCSEWKISHWRFASSLTCHQSRPFISGVSGRSISSHQCQPTIFCRQRVHGSVVKKFHCSQHGIYDNTLRPQFLPSA